MADFMKSDKAPRNLVHNGELNRTLNKLRTEPNASNPFVASQSANTQQPLASETPVKKSTESK